MNILRPKDIYNKLYHFLGAIIIILNCIRHRLFGYRNPRPSSFAQIEKSIDYDFKIVERWNDYLCNYLKESNPFKNKIVLELGVGPDLGTGLLLLAKGAKKYIALDVNNLAGSVPVEFYGKLFEKLNNNNNEYHVAYLKDQLEKFKRGEVSQIAYIVDKNFRISKIKEPVDIVISQVAFEHFDDVGETIKEIGAVIKKGGILFSHVDLKTHSRWIQDRDPLNIYRYSSFFWDMFKFRGSPNRIRIPEYNKSLQVDKWSDIVIEPRTILEKEYVEKIIHTLSKRFCNYDISEMHILSFIMMARKN